MWSVHPVQLPHSPFVKFAFSREDSRPRKTLNPDEEASLILCNVPHGTTIEDCSRFLTRVRDCKEVMLTSAFATVSSPISSSSTVKSIEMLSSARLHNTFEHVDHSTVSSMRMLVASCIPSFYFSVSTDKISSLESQSVPTKEAAPPIHGCESGLKGYLQCYQKLYAPRSQIHSRVVADIERFDNERQAELLEKERRSREPDADGFVVVRSGAKRTGNKPLQHVKDDFYRFQVRKHSSTNVNSQLTKLREKFDEDRRKIARLKETRKFKPY
eukprot:ANDGO_05192.mRNA.1 Ribosomal RNA-processing protein 7